MDVEIGDPSEDEGRRVPRKVAEPRMPTCHAYLGVSTGRGEQAGHLRQEERQENAIPEVHMECCFMGRKSDDVQPIWVARDRDTRMTVSFLVQKGAVDDCVNRRLLQFFRELGYHENNVVVRSDQESPMRAVAEKLAKERGEAQTILEHSRVRSSGSNGVVERAIKEVEYQVRTMKSALHQSVKTDIGAESNILTWMIEFAGMLINRYLVARTAKRRTSA